MLSVAQQEMLGSLRRDRADIEETTAKGRRLGAAHGPFPKYPEGDECLTYVPK